MRRLSETQVRVLLAAIVLLPGLLLTVKIVTGIGPSLPGPRIREVLGVVEPFGACTPSPEGVRVPTVPISATAAARWRREPDVQEFADEEVRAVAVGDTMYVGSAVRPNDDGTIFSPLGTLYEYDPGEGALRRLPAVPVPAHHTEIVGWRGNVYIFGGFTKGEASRGVWRYTPANGKWKAMADMPRPRGALSGAVIGDRFYAIGGASSAVIQHPQVYRTLDIYDFRTDSWTPGPSMAAARHHLAAAAVGGHLYVVGGRSNESMALTDVERFDPATSTWERLTPLPLGSGGLGAVAWKGRLIVLGGGDDSHGGWVTPATWSYAPSSGTWTRLADMKVPRHGFGAAIWGGRLYALGGAPCPRYGSTPAVESVSLG
jgi:hypothetical protein